MLSGMSFANAQIVWVLYTLRRTICAALAPSYATPTVENLNESNFFWVMHLF
jgi:hypothetical protein